MELHSGIYPTAVVESWLRDEARLAPNSRAWKKALKNGKSVEIGDQSYLLKPLGDGRYEVFRATAADVQQIFKILGEAANARQGTLGLPPGRQTVALAVLAVVVIAALALFFR